MYTSLNLLDPMKEVISVTGPLVRGAGWYGPTNGLHTVAIKVQNFTGRVSVQATIATNPITSDWFTVLPNNIPYIQYPQPGYIVISPSTGETSTYGFNFTCSAVWVRAIVDRSYFLPSTVTPMFISLFGLVDSILLKYGNAVGEFQYRRGWEQAPDPNKLNP